MLGRNNDSDSLKDQLIEMKKKEALMQKKLDEQVKIEQLEREKKFEEKQEKELLDNEERRKKLFEKETKRIKELEESQRKYAKKQAKKEKLKDHPDGCFCPKCDELRKEEKPEIKSKHIKFSFMNKFKRSPSSPSLPSSKQKTVQIPTQNIEETDAKIHPNRFTDIAVLGLRLAVGISFIVHGMSKMEGEGAMFSQMLVNWGVPIELSFPIAYAELVCGILLSIGFLTRVASVIIGIIMLGAIFVVKGASALIGQGGVELDVIILAAVAVLGVFGPGKLSVANLPIKGMLFTRKLQ